MNPELGALLRTRSTVVWLVLIAATALSWALGTDHGGGASHGHELSSTIIIVIAFAKLRFVAMYFMELREAPRVLKGLLEWYCVGACTAILAVYLCSA